MSETVKWKGEVEFAGTVEQFREFVKLVERPEYKVQVPELIRKPGRLPGLLPIPITDFLTPDAVKRLTEGAPTLRVNFIKGIAGGIRVPHMHVGPDVMLIGPKPFAEYAGELAKALAQKRVGHIADYPEVMMQFAAGDEIR